MSCSCGNNTCNNTCGCPQQIKGSCVFYQGGNLSCLDVTKGDDYDSILSNLNAIVCDLVTPSGNTTVVAPCNSNIIVTPVTVGSTTTYTVCLNSDITDDILYNTTNILNLQNCVTNTVANIVSDTLTRSIESHNSCGNVLRLEIPTPSGIPIYDGIIYNDLNKIGTSGAVGDKILKSFTTDYDNYNFTEEDEIRFKSNGQIKGDGAIADIVKFEVLDGSSITPLYSGNFNGFDKINKQSWRLEGDITYTDITSGEVAININFFANTVQNGDISNFTGNSKLVVNSIFNVTDFTTLTLRLVYDHQSTSGATNNFARQLMVEVRKKI